MWRTLWILLAIQSLGVLFFLKGFLLTRFVLHESSPPCNSPNRTAQCPPKRFQRAVWLVIDALRYDFMYYNESAGSSPPHYVNQMKNVRNYVQNRPNNARLFRFLADPPTVTMQRLKGLTTGSLPTFVDVGSNLNSYRVEEDNLIQQLKSNNHTITFMGDDVWVGLYPDHFDRSIPFHPHNIRDLDTVDTLVIENMMSELNNSPNDFIIGHTLGVDHCGHIYRPNNKLMALKLIQMDNFIKSIFEAVDNNTIVFVFGDHGMTEIGEHAGDTPEEVDSALLIYSPQSIFDHKKSKSEDTVHQTDIVPTVSLLLGVPIPFSNVGMVILDLFNTSKDVDSKTLSLTSSRDFLTALKANADQLNSFITAQNQYKKLSSIPMKSLLETYQMLNKQYTEVINSSDSTLLNTVADFYIDYLKKVRKVCSASWAEFDIISMVIGVSILLVHLVIVLASLIEFNTEDLVGIIASIKLYLFSDWFQCVDVVVIVIALMHSLSLLSTSFIIYEGYMVTFFSQSLLLALIVAKVLHSFSQIEWVYPPLNKEKRDYVLKSDRNVMYCCWGSIGDVLYTSALPFFKVMICVYLSSYFYICRDHQIDCTMNNYIFQRFQLNWFCTIRYAVSVFTYIVTMKYFTGFLTGLFTYNFSHYKKFQFPKYVRKVVSFLSIISHMTFLTMMSYEIVPVWVFRILFFVVLYIVIYGINHPFKTNVNWTLVSVVDSFRHASSDRTVPLVLAPYSWLVLSLWILVTFVVVVANDFLFISVSLGLVQLVFTVKMLRDTPQVSLLTRALICSLYSYQYFFAFGHHATLPSIRVDATFIGIYGDITFYKFPIAGVLVTVNMLASQMLSSLILPLLLPYDKDKTLPLLYKTQLWCMLLGSFKLICIAVCAALHRRHLMIWTVFAPRLMYEAAFQAVLNVLSIITYKLISYYDIAVKNLMVTCSNEKEP